MIPTPVVVVRVRRAILAVLLSTLAPACADPVTALPGSAGLQLVAPGFDLPVFLTAPPGDTSRLFVVEQSGRIRIIRGDTVLAAPFIDLSAALICCGERGLLGLAFHPQYATNGFFFAHYSAAGSGDTRIVRYHVSLNPDVADAASAAPVLSQVQPFTNHNGGMIAFGPDGFLYIGLGDGGSGGDPQGNGQNKATMLGKILRIDVSNGLPYVLPATNPFIGEATSRAEIWALGLRNPWRFSFDRLTHELYIGEVGQNAVEEIDVEPAGTGGRNYGWNPMEGSTCFIAGCSSGGLTLPAHEYSHADGCSVTGGYVYRGNAVPALQGRYLYSDYCSGWVRSFRMENGQAVEHTDWPSLAPGGTVSSFGEDARGELYILAHDQGTVFRIVRTTP